MLRLFRSNSTKIRLFSMNLVLILLFANPAYIGIINNSNKDEYRIIRTTRKNNTSQPKQTKAPEPEQATKAPETELQPVQTKAPTQQPVQTKSAQQTKAPEQMTQQPTTTPNFSSDDSQILDGLDEEVVEDETLPNDNVIGKDDNVTNVQETQVIDETASLVPTYNCIGYYFTAEKSENVSVYYKESEEDTFKPAYAPVYSEDDKLYKGSIVNLKSDTKYDVKLSVMNSDGTISSRVASVRTWSESVNIAKSVKLSELTDQKILAGVILDGVLGSEDGFIYIDADVAINDDESDVYLTIKGDAKVIKAYENTIKKDEAVIIKACEYVIFANVNASGGALNCMRITSSSSNIRVDNCDLSNYGRVAAYTNDYGVGYTAEGTKINYDSGIKIEGCSKITIQNCNIHDPAGNANAWNDSYSSASHPTGPNAIYVLKTLGNNVIRNNVLKGSTGHRFNDVIEGWNNSAVNGGLYRDTDICGNRLSYANDDGIELDGGQINIRVYDNVFTDSLTAMSIVPNLSGPSYIFRNEVYNLSDATGKSNFVIKTCGGGNTTYGYTFIFNNTFIAKDYVFSNTSSAARAANIVTRNNILATKGYVVFNNIADVVENDYDYDMMFNISDRKIFKNKTAQESNGIYAKADFSDILSGNYTLTQLSAGIDSGIYINNFSEGYIGGAPDMGAHECY